MAVIVTPGFSCHIILKQGNATLALLKTSHSTQKMSRKSEIAMSLREVLLLLEMQPQIEPIRPSTKAKTLPPSQFEGYLRQ